MPQTDQTLLPLPRSAHCLINRYPDKFSSPRGLLLFGGDTGLACQRLNDIWFLDANKAARGMPFWERLEPLGTPPAACSNSAAAICGDRFVVFGGWDGSGTTPLNSTGILNLPSMTWLPSCAVSGTPPSPRGQPGIVATTDEGSGQALVTFGGWDGARRFDDMHRLDLKSLEWTALQPSGGERPPARADHTCSLWRYCDDGVWKDLMVCFGGSTNTGPANDVWLYDFRWHRWTQAHCAGEVPSPRSSHAAVTLGDLLITTGGQCHAQVYADMHILDLVSLTWHRIAVPGLSPLCRHAIAVCDGLLWSFGGWDGQATRGDTLRIPLADILAAGKQPQKLLQEGLGCSRPEQEGRGKKLHCSSARQHVAVEPQPQAPRATGMNADALNSAKKQYQGLAARSLQPGTSIWLMGQLAALFGVAAALLAAMIGSVQALASAARRSHPNSAASQRAAARQDAALPPQAAQNGMMIVEHGAKSTGGPQLTMQGHKGNVAACKADLPLVDSCIPASSSAGERMPRCGMQPTFHTPPCTANAVPACTPLDQEPPDQINDRPCISSGSDRVAIQTACTAQDQEPPDQIKDRPCISSGSNRAAIQTLQPSVRPASPQQLWGTKQAPYSLQDLPLADQSLPAWKLIRRLHDAAVAAERDTYVDPDTGYTVFTKRFLKSRPCCGNKCRHCPHGYVNVAQQAESEAW